MTMNADRIIKILGWTAGVGFIASAILLVLPSVSQREPASTVPASERIKDQGVLPEGALWNGGKMQAAKVSSSLSDEVAPDADLDLEITTTPLNACAGLRTEVRGMDGVEVYGNLIENSPNCAVGVESVHRLGVRVPSGVAGYVVVDVSYVSNGGTFKSSHAIALRAEGAEFKIEASKMLKHDAQGKPMIVMESGK